MLNNPSLEATTFSCKALDSATLLDSWSSTIAVMFTLYGTLLVSPDIFTDIVSDPDDEGMMISSVFVPSSSEFLYRNLQLLTVDDSDLVKIIWSPSIRNSFGGRGLVVKTAMVGSEVTMIELSWVVPAIICTILMVKEQPGRAQLAQFETLKFWSSLTCTCGV